MKLLLLGGDGQLGQRLMQSLAPLGEVVATTLGGTLVDDTACERLDLTDLDAIAPLIERIAPDVVVNATAHTAVDKAESEPDLAHRINADAPARIAQVPEQFVQQPDDGQQGEHACLGLGCVTPARAREGVARNLLARAETVVDRAAPKAALA